MRYAISALLFLFAVTGASAATDAELMMKIVGSWADTGSCKDGALVFNADGTFISKAPDGSPPEDSLNGTYTITGGKLAGKGVGPAAGVEMPTVSITFGDDGKLTMGDGPSADVLIACK